MKKVQKKDQPQLQFQGESYMKKRKKLKYKPLNVPSSMPFLVGRTAKTKYLSRCGLKNTRKSRSLENIS